MDFIEIEKRRKIADLLGNMSESVMRKNPPFDQIPMNLNVIESYYTMYISHIEKIKKTFKQDILESIIVNSRWQFQERLIGNEEPFKSSFPEHSKNIENFIKWIRQNKRPQWLTTQQSFYEKKIRVKNIIKQMVKQNKPDFFYNRNLIKSNLIPFPKTWFSGRNALIFIDEDREINNVDFLIGFQPPTFYISIASIFGGTQCKGGYNTREELEKIIYEAMDLIDILLPDFLTRIQQSLKLT
jgi:hypothetical protein